MSESSRRSPELPTERRGFDTPVAVGVSAACLAYALSLAGERLVPDIHSILEVPLAGGVRPAYYLRVAASLAIAGCAAMLMRRRTISERWLAWGTASALAISVVMICALP